MAYYEDFQKYRNSLNINTGKYPIRVIDGNQILEQKETGDMVAIGHTLDYCNEIEQMAIDAVDKAESYKNALIEHGIIKKEKTQDEIIQEQSSIIREQSELLEKTLSIVAKLEEKLLGGGVKDEYTRNDFISQESKSENCQAIGAKPTKNRPSGKALE